MPTAASARRFSDPDEDILILERALNWRASPPLPWSSFASSMVLHIATLTTLMIYLPGEPLRLPPAAEQQPVAHSFLPLTFPSTAAPPPLRQATLQIPGRLDLPLIETPETAPSSVTVNLNSIQLSFALDLRNQLPEVVASQHGMLALLDKQDLSVAYYLMQPPGWKPRPTITDVS